ncbi:MAG: helix-turn-helix domain-containing protein [Brevundimonas sp.]
MSETDTPEIKPNRRQLAKARTIEKIRNAARVRFTAKGYFPTTIRDIATDCKMSTGAIFANFEDKEALYVDLFGHKPVSSELGRVLGFALIRLLDDLDAGFPVDDPATRHARDAIALIPGLDQAWEVEKAKFARGDGFRKYVLGADGEPVDVTPIG